VAAAAGGHDGVGTPRRAEPSRAGRGEAAGDLGTGFGRLVAPCCSWPTPYIPDSRKRLGPLVTERRRSRALPWPGLRRTPTPRWACARRRGPSRIRPIGHTTMRMAPAWHGVTQHVWPSVRSRRHLRGRPGGGAGSVGGCSGGLGLRWTSAGVPPSQTSCAALGWKPTSRMWPRLRVAGASLSGRGRAGTGSSSSGRSQSRLSAQQTQARARGRGRRDPRDSDASRPPPRRRKGVAGAVLERQAPYSTVSLTTLHTILHIIRGDKIFRQSRDAPSPARAPRPPPAGPSRLGVNPTATLGKQPLGMIGSILAWSA
jgi:hypothetical protein